MRRSLLAALAGALTGSLPLVAQHGAAPAYAPRVESAGDDAAASVAAFELGAGLAAELLAAEPQLANPVAFDVGPDRRIYVVETHRLRAGVIDMRDHQGWVLEDLAARTVADRVDNIRKHFAADLAAWTRDHERVRCLIDDDGDGRPDRSTTFADGFHTLADGIAAGVLVDGDDVWFTNIPSVWKLTDADRDGVAEARTEVHTGFGVHFSLIGHDLHGLRIGPDRRVWFSIGDRGFHVDRGDGGAFAFPHEGAVLRCELDGSGLEVVHRGLRNPQELAFDDFGELFTGDNNSDGGDQARWVHVVDGADSGWRIGYQWLGDRGAWHSDRLWHLRSDEQAEWILPPCAHVASGPSGLTADAGTGMPARFRGAFYLCDFRGSASNSGVLAVHLAPAGASYTVAATERVVWNALITDVEIDPAGGLLISDWVRGWGKTGRGRIERVFAPELAADPLVAATAAILRDGMGGRDDAACAALLEHPDRRVRQAAAFALVDRGAADRLLAAATRAGTPTARVQALFAYGALARHGRADAAALRGSLDDADPRLRTVAARLLGEAGDAGAIPALLARLADPAPAVIREAALALGRLRAPATAELFALLRRNADADATLRHAAVRALERCGDRDAVRAALEDPDRAVRAGALLTLRRHADPALRGALDDADPRLALEAARAIHDLPIPAALADLGALAARTDLDPRLTERALGALRLRGDGPALRALLAVAARGDAPEAARLEALAIVAEWLAPHRQDRVHGNVIDLPPRSPFVTRAVVAELAPSLFPAARGAVATAACRALGALRTPGVAAVLAEVAADATHDGATRAAALTAHGDLPDVTAADRGRLAAAVTVDDPLELRRAAARTLAELDPEAAVPTLASLVGDGPIDQQRDALETLAGLGVTSAAHALTSLVARVESLPRAVQADVLAAAQRCGGEAAAAVAGFDATAADDPLRRYAVALEGGDARRGARLFREHPAAQCQRCHLLGGQGGNAGPALDGIGARRDRDWLLAALVAPSRDIAEGFDQAVIRTTDGTTVAGVVVREDDASITLVGHDAREIGVPRSAIAERTTSGSAMPPMGALLERTELRDLVEFLATRR